MDAGYQAAASAIEAWGDAGVTAVICADDLLAFGVMRAAAGACTLPCPRRDLDRRLQRHALRGHGDAVADERRPAGSRSRPPHRGSPRRTAERRRPLVGLARSLVSPSGSRRARCRDPGHLAEVGRRDGVVDRPSARGRPRIPLRRCRVRSPRASATGGRIPGPSTRSSCRAGKVRRGSPCARRRDMDAAAVRQRDRRRARGPRASSAAA